MRIAAVGSQSGVRVMFQVWVDVEGGFGLLVLQGIPLGRCSSYIPSGGKATGRSGTRTAAPAEEGNLPLCSDCCSFSCLFSALACFVILFKKKSKCFLIVLAIKTTRLSEEKAVVDISYSRVACLLEEPPARAGCFRSPRRAAYLWRNPQGFPAVFPAPARPDLCQAPPVPGSPSPEDALCQGG